MIGSENSNNAPENKVLTVNPQNFNISRGQNENKLLKNRFFFSPLASSNKINHLCRKYNFVKGKNMKQSEIKRLIETTVEVTVEKLLNRKELEVPRTQEEWLTTSEAAKMIGISPYRLRMLKDKFEHQKSGDAQSGRLLFKKSSLLESYIR